jgi:hypothetical protein
MLSVILLRRCAGRTRKAQKPMMMLSATPSIVSSLLNPVIRAQPFLIFSDPDL